MGKTINTKTMNLKINVITLFFTSYLLSVGQLLSQDNSKLLLDYDLKIDKVVTFEKSQKQLREPKHEISQFNPKNPFFHYSPETILNNPYYPYTKNYPIDSAITFYRSGGEIPITVDYHYNINDSIIVAIIYDWEIGRHEMNIAKREKIVNKSKLVNDDYLQKYNEILNGLTQQYGQPSYFDDGTQMKKSSITIENKLYEDTYFEKSTFWDKDKYAISLTWIVDSKRIRLNYYKKME